MPELTVVRRLAPGEAFDPPATLAARRGNIAAIVSGSPAAPRLTGTAERIDEWGGPVSLLAAHALDKSPETFPEVALSTTATSTAQERRGQIMTAQAGQTLLFLLTMLLAGIDLTSIRRRKRFALSR